DSSALVSVTETGSESPNPNSDTRHGTPSTSIRSPSVTVVSSPVPPSGVTLTVTCGSASSYSVISKTKESPSSAVRVYGVPSTSWMRSSYSPSTGAGSCSATVSAGEVSEEAEQAARLRPTRAAATADRDARTTVRESNSGMSVLLWRIPRGYAGRGTAGKRTVDPLCWGGGAPALPERWGTGGEGQPWHTALGGSRDATGEGDRKGGCSAPECPAVPGKAAAPVSGRCCPAQAGLRQTTGSGAAGRCPAVRG